MKRKFGFLVTLILCLCLAFSLAACNNGDDSKGGDITFKTPEEITATFTNGKFTLKISSTGTDAIYYTVAQTSEGCFYAFHETPAAIPDGTLLIKDGNAFKMYSVTGGKRAFVMAYESDDVADAYVGNLFTTYFAAYSSLGTDGFAKKGSSTVAGRDCTKYAYSYKGFGTAVSYEYHIDNETGMCMKYVGSATSGGEGGSMAWEMTEFVLGNASLSDYKSLPLEGNDDGPTIGDTTTFPTKKIAALATYFTESTLPALIGATKFTYSTTPDGTAVMSAEGVTQAEYDTYIQTLKTNDYFFLTGEIVLTAKKLLSEGNMISVVLAHDAETKIMSFIIEAIPACEAEIVLPQNFKLTYSASGTDYTIIKIGNGFYKEYTDDYGDTYKSFAKYNATANSWTAFDNDSETNGEWQSRGGYSYDSLDEVLSDFLDYVYWDNFLDRDSFTKSGTENIAGFECNKFVGDDYGTAVTYYKSYNNFIFKKVLGSGGDATTEYEVKEYSTNISAFPNTIPA